jgi:hypothetical protein
MLDNFVARIPPVIKADWDEVYASRLAGFPVNVCYAKCVPGVGTNCATYVFDPSTFIEGERSRQMRYRPVVDSEFSLQVVLYADGKMETFKYRGSECICEASGIDFATAMLHTTIIGLACDEPIDKGAFDCEPGD